MQDRRIDRPDLQFDVAGVAKFFGQRNVLPAEFRRAHVDGVEIGRRPLPAIQQAGAGLEGDGGLAGLLEQAAHHAAHAVAAGAGFRAVIVVDADEGLGAVAAAAAAAPSTGRRARLRRGHRARFFRASPRQACRANRPRRSRCRYRSSWRMRDWRARSWNFPISACLIWPMMADCPVRRACMTHLSWDESGPCVLGMAALWRAWTGTCRDRLGWMENSQNEPYQHFPLGPGRADPDGSSIALGGAALAQSPQPAPAPSATPVPAPPAPRPPPRTGPGDLAGRRPRPGGTARRPPPAPPRRRRFRPPIPSARSSRWSPRRW